MCKNFIFAAALFFSSVVIGQISNRIEGFFHVGIEKSVVKHFPNDSKFTSGWTTAEYLTGNYNPSYVLGVNFNTSKKIQLSSSLGISNLNFDAINAIQLHTISIGQHSNGQEPYYEQLDYRLKFNFIYATLGIGYPIRLSENLSITPTISGSLSFLHFYSWKARKKNETWDNIDYFSNEWKKFEDRPIPGLIPSVSIDYKLNKNKLKNVILRSSASYHQRFSSLSTWNVDFWLSALSFNTGIIFPIKGSHPPK